MLLMPGVKLPPDRRSQEATCGKQESQLPTSWDAFCLGNALGMLDYDGDDEAPNKNSRTVSPLFARAPNSRKSSKPGLSFGLETSTPSRKPS